MVEGYGILQPRLPRACRAPAARGTARLFGSRPGIDPYTRAVSDVYQDLFMEEGSFIGKSIYDVDAFEQALNGRFPEDRILRHDLLEGCYTRAGLLSECSCMRMSLSLQRGHKPAAPLDSRRLAAPAMGAARRSRPRRACSAQPALGIIPVEDLR